MDSLDTFSFYRSNIMWNRNIDFSVKTMKAISGWWQPELKIQNNGTTAQHSHIEDVTIGS